MKRIKNNFLAKVFKTMSALTDILTFSNEPKPRQPQGQILIAVLLIVVITIAVALTVTGRSVSEQKVTTVVDDSSKALSLAETGIEQAYRAIADNPANLPIGPQPVDVSNPNFFNTGSTANYEIKTLGKDDHAFISSSPLFQGEVLQVLLSDPVGNQLPCATGNYPGTGTLNIAFGENTNNSDAKTPAAAVSIFYKTGAVMGVKRVVLDPHNGARFSQEAPPTPSLLFSGAPTSPYSIAADKNNLNQTFSFAYMYNIPIGLPGSSLCLVRVRTLFNDTVPQRVAVQPTNSNILPFQGWKINSAGFNTQTNTNRKLEVNTAFPSFPGIGDFVLFNGSDNQVIR